MKSLVLPMLLLSALPAGHARPPAPAAYPGREAPFWNAKPDAVLAPGGSAPAAALRERFLGRPFDERAWRAWLEEGE
jgi:hypothetical protein